MSAVTNYVEKNITKTATNLGSNLLNKLVDNKGKNIKTLTFPHNLENQAQSTYMVIYILDNTANKQKFSTTQFNSDINTDTYEIKAITFLKDYAKQELNRLKKNAKEMATSWVKDSASWLKRQIAMNDTVSKLTLASRQIKEVGDWANEWLVPKRKSNPSKELQDQLDPTKHPQTGYQLEAAVALQMPTSDLTYTYENGWESKNTSTYATIKAAISGVTDAVGGFIGGDNEKKTRGFKQLGAVGTKIGDAIGDAVTGGGFSATRQAAGRYVANPVLVFNYTIPEPRTFEYSFTLYPRNKDELYTIYNIIQMLKFYALPEGGKDASKGGLYIKYPAKFAVKFYTNGYENKWLPSTATLGLTSLSETLTGDNGDMAFFENYFDKHSGNPPRLINLTLKFTELTIMTRDYANSGY